MLLFRALLAFAGLANARSVVHERRSAPVPGWTRIRRAEPNATIPILRIGLKQANIHTFHDQLMRVSDLESAQYGQHWTSDEVKAYFRPSEGAVREVFRWLEEKGGIAKERIGMSAGENWVEVKNATVAELEEILSTEYHIYKHSSGRSHLACMNYSVPRRVQPHIELITPTLHFNPRPARNKKRSSPSTTPSSQMRWSYDTQAVAITSPADDDLANCGTAITPACYRALYNIPTNPTILSPNKNSYAIVEYTPQAYRPSDLDLLFSNFSAELVGHRPVLVSIDGGVVQDNEVGFHFNVESNYDVGYAMMMLGPEMADKLMLYQVEDLPEGNAQLLSPFDDLLDALDGSFCTFEGGDDPSVDGVYPDPADGGFKGPKDCGDKPRANVISTSYASNEGTTFDYFDLT